WMWDRWLRARFASHLIDLTASMGDQAAYATLTLRLIEHLVAELGSTHGQGRRLRPTTNASGEGQKDGKGVARLFEDENGMFEPGDSMLDDGAREVSLLHGRAENAKAPPYSAFTTAHDLVLHATELVDG